MKDRFDLNMHNHTLFNAVCENGVYGITDENVSLHSTKQGLEMEMKPKGHTLFSYLMYREHAIRFNSDELFWPLDINEYPYCVLEYKVVPAAKETKYPRIACQKTKNSPMLIYFKAIDGEKKGLGYELLPVKYHFHQEVIDLRRCFSGMKNPTLYMFYFFFRTFFSDVNEKIIIKQISFRKRIDRKKHSLKPACDVKKDLKCYSDVDLKSQYSWMKKYYHFGVNSPRAANHDICKKFKINIEDYYNFAFRDQVRHGVTLHWLFHGEADDKLETIVKSAKKYHIDILATLKNPLPLQNLTHYSNLSFDEKKYERFVKKAVKKFDQYDNMKMWFLTDEPVDKVQLATYLKAKQYIEKYDKKRPCIFNLSLPNFINELGNKTAAHMFDSYPVVNPNPNFWRVGPEVDFAVNHTDHPVWTVLQTFERLPRYRMPTNSELDVMSNLALLNGTSGLNFHIYANYPWSMQPNYGANLINVFGKSHLLWDHLGSYGRVLYGLKNVVVSRKRIGNDLVKLESNLFDSVSGPINSVDINLFSMENDKIFFVMNNNPHKRSSFVLYKKHECKLYRIIVRDILTYVGKGKVVSFSEIGFDTKYNLKPGECAWIVVGDKNKAKTFCEKIKSNLIELESRMSWTYVDQYSGIESRESQQFITDYQCKLNHSPPEHLESLIRIRNAFIAEAENQNPQVNIIREKLFSIRDYLSNLEIQLCDASMEYESIRYKKNVSSINRYGKEYLALFHLRNLYEKENSSVIEKKIDSLQERMIKGK